jgi:F420-dependent oxidoreductase-like protein
MRVSLNVTNFSWTHDARDIAPRLSDLVRRADEAGVDTVWVSDHLLQADPTSGAEDTEMLEAYTTLGYLAAQSKRVNLGTMVTGVTFRPPALLIKAVTTLDVLSAGRAWLGIGAGYQQREAESMGLSMPPVRERFERLEETLRLALQMWAGDDDAFEGTHYHLTQPTNSPGALRKPHPPVLIGGAGEQKTLRLVAQYGDACNLFDIPDNGETVRRKLSVLAGHCEAIGRPYDSIDKTLSTRLEPDESAESFIERCRTFSSWGIEHVVLVTRGAWQERALSTVAEAVPSLEGNGPASMAASGRATRG